MFHPSLTNIRPTNFSGSQIWPGSTTYTYNFSIFYQRQFDQNNAICDRIVRKQKRTDEFARYRCEKEEKKREKTKIYDILSIPNHTVLWQKQFQHLSVIYEPLCL